MKLHIPFTKKEVSLEKRSGGFYLGVRQRQEESEFTIPGIGLPEGGQSSIPSTASATSVLAGFGEIKPEVALDYIPIIRGLCLGNPDFSQTISNFCVQANTEHDVVVDAESEALVEAVVEDLNLTAKRIYPRSCGVDGLINHLLREVLETGALSAEAVLDLSMSRVKQVVIVPAENIRFLPDENGEPQPWQKVSALTGSANQLVQLNPITYRYFALFMEKDNPYALPPFLSALEPAVIQKLINDNIHFIAKKLGMLGLIDVKIAPPPQGNMSNANYKKYLKKYLTEIKESLLENYYNGLLVHYDELEIAFHRFSEGSGQGVGGIIEIIRHIEQLLFSGVDSDPAMHGRSYSTTESYAAVVYRKMIRRSAFLRLIIKWFLEYVYRLESWLAGFSGAKISVQFEENAPFDLDASAQHKLFDAQAADLKARIGMGDPDLIASELGYPGWFDKSKIDAEEPAIPAIQTQKSYRFHYEGSLGLYVHRPNRAVIASSGAISRAGSDDALEKSISGYLARLRPYDQRWREFAAETVKDFLLRHSETDFINEEAFAKALLEELEKVHRLIFDTEEVRKEVEAVIEESYRFFRLKDTIVLAGVIDKLTLIDADTETVKFLKKLDSWYFSKFINNNDMRGPLLEFFKEEYLLKGASLFRPGSETLDAFRNLFADRLVSLSDSQVSRIAETSVQRLRTWAHFRSYEQAGINLVRVVEVMDANTCDLCRPLHGKVIAVERAVEWIDKFTGMDSEEYGTWLKDHSPTEKYVSELIGEFGGDENAEQKALDYMVDQGIGWPPFHPRCRGRTARERLASPEKKLWAKKAA